MKVAIVHDWLYGGGAERVVEELHTLYPKAPIYTSYATKEWRKKLDNKVVTGYLQKWPFGKLRRFLPLLRQLWFSHLDLSGYDLVISSSGNGESKFVRVKKPAIHVSYCHTPTHFYWRHHENYIQNPSMRPKWLARLGLKLLVRPLRKRDFDAAQQVDYFIANSSHIQKDIKKYYKKESVVIHPPVDIKRFHNAKQPLQKRGFVTLGRQVPMKKTDIIIQACKELKVPLSVIGNGPEHSKLVRMTGPTIHFKTEITNELLPEELASAEGFIFASFEDFGIAPVEAMAAGTPVIAYKKGGALDYVIPGKTGEFFEEQNVDVLVKALNNFDAKTYNSETISEFSKHFSSEAFAKRFTSFINQLKI